jgi:acyl carrier protein
MEIARIMEIERNAVKNLIHDVAKRVVAEQPEPLRFDFDDDTVFVGGKTGFDSIGLLSFLVEVEQSVEERYGKRISLADQKALAEPVPPFKTISLLADYVHRRLSNS